MKTRQPGKPTYIRFKIRAIFEENFLENEFSRICEEIESKLENVATTFNLYPWTGLGPSGIIKVVDRNENQIILQIGVNRDGWTIRIDSINRSEFFPQVNNEIFGDKNKKAAWTQQTSLVVPMTIELVKELREELNA